MSSTGVVDAECVSCRQVTSVNGNWDREEADVSFGLGQVSIARCTSCLKSLGLILDGRFHTLRDVLYDKSKETDGWAKEIKMKQAIQPLVNTKVFLSNTNLLPLTMDRESTYTVETERDKRVLFTLSQIIYKDLEEPDESLMEVEFAFPPPTDLIKLLWVNRKPVGFYTVKLKGTFDIETMSVYTMTTLDTLFIRKGHRGKGLGYSAIKSLLKDFPEQNIGFSYPISLPMGKDGHIQSYSILQEEQKTLGGK